MRNAALIVGAVIALVIVLAVAIPPLIDWSRYKGEIVARVQAATGRPAAIDGAVSLRLLPSPALSAEGVVIGNPPGMDGVLARAERLRLKLKVAPLLTGTVQLDSLELDRPVLALARAADGRGNWQFDTAPATTEAPPAAEAPPHRTARPEPPPPVETDESLPVNALTIRDGTISYGDSLRLSGLDADIALGGRSGPFLLKGSGQLGGVAVTLDGAVERLAPGRASPATVSLRLPGDDAGVEFAGLVSRLSGGETLRGRINAKAADFGRTLAKLGLTPLLPPGALALTGELTVTGEEATLAELALSVGEAQATGAVSAAFGAIPQVDVRLAAATLDLDSWTRAVPAKTAAPAVPPAAAPSPAAPAQPTAAATPADFVLPRDIFVSANLGVDTLSWHGQAVRQARLEAILDGGEVMLRQATAQLPGATDAAAEGTLAAEAGQPVVDGKIRVKSDNARALLTWLGADVSGAPPDRLRTLELNTPVRLSWPEVKLNDFRLAVDALPVRGHAAARLGDHPALSLTAALTGMEVMVKGRVAAGNRVEDGAFKLTSSQGLRPLRAFGLTPPAALERLGALTAEGTASGTLDAVALDARAESGGVSLTTKGTLANLILAPRADLAVQARAASVAQVVRLFGDGRAQGGGAFALDARIAGDGRAIDISGLTLRAGPSSLSGQGRAELGGAKPVVTADLSADTLALDTLLGAERSGRLLPGGPMLPPTLAPQPQAILPAALVGAGASPFSREPLELSALNAVDGRLTLRAQTVTAKAWRLDNALLQAAVQGGTATVERLTGKLLNGELSATAKLSAGATPALSGHFTILGADLGAARLGGGGMTVTQGRLDAEARFTTTGRSSQDMAGRLDGDGKLLVRNGVLDGFDLPAVNRQMGNLRNIGSLLAAVQSGLSGGKTPFSQLVGTFRADNGMVTSRDLRLEADGGGATADTQVNLPEWSTRTAIAFRLASAPQTPLGLRLEGPLENPRKVVDVNAIQQHMVSRGLGQALKGLGGDTPADPQQADQPREKNTGKNILKNLLKGLGGQ